MGEHKRLYILLQLIRLLSQGIGYPVNRLARRYDVTERTIYRYLALLREVGFNIVNERKRYRIDTTGTDPQLLPALTEDELAILMKSVFALPVQSPKRSPLLKKLQNLTHPNLVIDLIVNQTRGAVIRDLTEAIHHRDVVVLKKYQSTGEQPGEDRRVEPIGFTTNLRYLWAYDRELSEVRLFKPDRIESVKQAGEQFEWGTRHHVRKPDPFGMIGKPECDVDLSCSRRAVLLLQEEYPEVSCPETVSKTDNNVRIHVQGFEGVGRFVLGLSGEITPEGPPEFVKYLQSQQRHANWVKS